MVAETLIVEVPRIIVWLAKTAFYFAIIFAAIRLFVMSVSWISNVMFAEEPPRRLTLDTFAAKYGPLSEADRTALGVWPAWLTELSTLWVGSVFMTFVALIVFPLAAVPVLLVAILFFRQMSVVARPRREIARDIRARYGVDESDRLPRVPRARRD